MEGFRIDTLKHVEPSFGKTSVPGFVSLLRARCNFFMFGEAFDGSDELLGSYTQGNGVDSLFYFSAY